MEGEGGVVFVNVWIKDGMCCNLFVDYFWEMFKCLNIILLIGVIVYCVEFDGIMVMGVIFEKDGEVIFVGVNECVVLLVGVINIFKILM